MSLRWADDVGVEPGDGAIYVARLPDGPILVLEGPSALIWEECEAGPRDSLAQRVAERTDRDAADIAADVEAFVESMLARDLLVED